MEKVVCCKDIENLKENKIIGELVLDNSIVEFTGKDNILFCKGTIKLKDARIRFTANNSVVYFNENEFPFSIDVRVGNDCVFYLGKDAYLNRTSHFYATERKNILIGNECLISFDSYFRTADPHIIYDTIYRKRINNSASILIGDHVWIGQNCLILKNTEIGSGTIIGGNSVVSGKKIESNKIYAGNPVRKVKEHVFWSDPKSTHDFTLDDQTATNVYDSDKYTYFKDRKTLDLRKLDECLMEFKTAKDKARYIDIHIAINTNKNRFFI